MEGRYSTRSPAVKRLMKEAQELCEPTDQYFAQPLEDNLFEWHFTIRGPVDSDFQAGLYHGRIILPVDYPMKPPSIIWLTPNGRFETNKKICLSISGHHPESWQPSWSIRTALLAIIGFMPTHPGGAIGSLDYKPEERKALAKKSRDWKCPICGDVSEILLEPSPESSQTSQEAKELASQISFQGEKPKSAENKSSDEATAASPPPSTTTPSTDAASSPAPPACTPASSPPENPPTPASNTPVLGNMYPPWMWPPVVPTFNSAMPPPFMQYPWTCLSMPQGGQQLGSVASQIPRFPYPPSHYTNRPFYPPGFALPPGVGMFPCPFPPPPPTVEHSVTDHNKYPPVSVSNSSLSPPSGNQGRESHSESPGKGSHSQSPGRGSHSQSPDAPRIPNIPPPSPASVVSSQTGNSKPVSPQCSPLRENVLHELLSKVKRVGSDTQTSPVSPQCSPLREHVLNELLSKVKRVGSDTQTSSDAAPDTAVGGESPQSLEEREGTVNAQINVESDSAVVNETPKLLTACTCKEAAALVSAPHSSDVSPNVKLENGEQVHDVLHDDNHATNLEPQMNLSQISNILKSAFDVPDDMAEENERQDGEALENPQDGGGYDTLGDQCPVEDKSQITDTDGSVSVRRKESASESTGREISHSELSVDPGKDGELGNLALEMSAIQQRFNFERHTSNSMPDLEKKFKPGSTKGLRQRQSAYAGVARDTAAPDEQTVSEPVNAGSGRQRIEAMAGDSTPANRQRFPQNAGVAGEVARNQAREARRADVAVPEPPPQSCVTCLILLGSFVTIVVILINRLFYLIDFSGIFY